MKRILPMAFACAVLLLFSCVKARVYRAELKARAAAEGREKILVQELLERRKETSLLTKTTENLARDLGKQDREILELKEQLAATNQAMGESAVKLSAEKAALEKKLMATNETLELRNASLQSIKAVREKRQSILKSIESELNKIYLPHNGAGISIEQITESIYLSLPDAVLFDAGTANISAKGKLLLQPLAEFLAARPSLAVEIVAYTDNVLPVKDKTLKDTWDWSLVRATQVTRILTREFNVNANQLTPVGKGEFYPLTSNETPEGRQKNRRTVVVFRPVLPSLPAE